MNYLALHVRTSSRINISKTGSCVTDYEKMINIFAQTISLFTFVLF